MTAHQLKRWRASLKLSQREAALALGITTRNYQYLEAGNHPISTAIAIACKWIAEQKERA